MSNRNPLVDLDNNMMVDDLQQNISNVYDVLDVSGQLEINEDFEILTEIDISSNDNIEILTELDIASDITLSSELNHLNENERNNDFEEDVLQSEIVFEDEQLVSEKSYTNEE